MKKLNVVLIYEHVAREIESLHRIQEELNKYKNIYCTVFSLRFQVFDIWKFHKSSVIDVIVMPFVYKENSLKAIRFLFENNNSPHIINLTHEQIRAPFNEFQTLPQDILAKYNVVHFVWTDSYKYKLRSVDVPLHNIHVTGNIRLESSRRNNVELSRRELAAKYSLSFEKKWAIYFESFNDIYSEKKISYFKSLGYKESDLVLRNQEAVEVRNALNKDLNGLSQDFFSDWEIIYRVHPGVGSSLTDNGKIRQISSESAYTWLSHITIAISAKSTVLLECGAFDVPAVRYDPSGCSERLMAYGLDKLEKITSFSELNNVDLVKVSDSTKKTSLSYIGGINDSVHINMAKIISNPATFAYTKKVKLPRKFSKSIFYINRMIFGIMSKYALRFILIKWKHCELYLSRYANDLPRDWIR
jgi:hypothetical protein